MPAPEATPPVVTTHRVTVEYPTAAGAAVAVREVDMTVARGKLTVLAGPSGSGKSSLLRAIAGLQRPSAGTVEVDGVELWALSARGRRQVRRRTMGVVLQAPSDNLIEELTAEEQVRLAARLRGVDQAESASLLSLVGLADRTDCRPGELSGGEQQRVAFAAAAIGRPQVLLADEPTAQLDEASGRALVSSLRALVDRGTTVLTASHDATVIDAADEVVRLADGRRVEP